MGTCLVLGGAECVWRDIEAYQGSCEAVVACNDIGAEWAGELAAWVSLHPQKFNEWIAKRVGPTPQRFFSHKLAHPNRKRKMPDFVEQTDFRFPGQDKTGSSGLFAAKVALIDLGFDDVVFCGVPMESTPHFFDDEPWRYQSVMDFRKQWKTVPAEYLARMRSMSGWTREFLGGPDGADG